MNPGIAEEAGKTAGVFMTIMKDQPLALALVVCNLVLLGLFFYVASLASTNRRHEFEAVLQAQTEVQKLLSRCVVPESHRTEFDFPLPRPRPEGAEKEAKMKVRIITEGGSQVAKVRLQSNMDAQGSESVEDFETSMSGGETVREAELGLGGGMSITIMAVGEIKYNKDTMATEVEWSQPTRKEAQRAGGKNAEDEKVAAPETGARHTHEEGPPAGRRR